VPDPVGTAPGERAYRSGDLARHLPDGNLEFLGRIDQQVKVRGFRVEPGEIEAAIAAHPAVAQAVVLALRDGAGGARLVACVAPEGAAAELGAWLAARLPDYMVPADFVFLESLPLTVNGKLDRRWLAERGPVLAQAGAAGGAGTAGPAALRCRPRTEAEELLAGIFGAVLGVKAVAADADFFALGGHSLLATQLLSRVREAFRVELPMGAIFAQPTVAGLAREIARAASAGGASGQYFSSGGNSTRKILARTAACVRAANAGLPLSISYSTTPSCQTSLAGPMSTQRLRTSPSAGAPPPTSWTGSTAGRRSG